MMSIFANQQQMMYQQISNQQQMMCQQYNTQIAAVGQLCQWQYQQYNEHNTKQETGPHNFHLNLPILTKAQLELVHQGGSFFYSKDNLNGNSSLGTTNQPCHVHLYEVKRKDTTKIIGHITLDFTKEIDNDSNMMSLQNLGETRKFRVPIFSGRLLRSFGFDSGTEQSEDEPSSLSDSGSIRENMKTIKCGYVDLYNYIYDVAFITDPCANSYDITRTITDNLGSLLKSQFSILKIEAARRNTHTTK
jgi:hypothetical protein